jgi:hypothetical protein
VSFLVKKFYLFLFSLIRFHTITSCFRLGFYMIGRLTGHSPVVAFGKKHNHHKAPNAWVNSLPQALPNKAEALLTQHPTQAEALNALDHVLSHLPELDKEAVVKPLGATKQWGVYWWADDLTSVYNCVSGLPGVIVTAVKALGQRTT